MRVARRPIELLVSDIDGTLLDSDQRLTQAARESVQGLRERGIKFSLASGRPPRGIKFIADELDVGLPYAGFNGAIIVDRDLTILEQSNIGAPVAQAVLAELSRSGVDHWIYRGTEWLVQDKRTPAFLAHVELEAQAVRFEPRIVPSYAGFETGIVKIIAVSDDLETVARIERAVGLMSCETALSGRSHIRCLDITAPGAHKGAAIRALGARTGVDVRNIATIGDMPSDVRMFQVSGMSIAMGEASLEVRSAATFSTASNDAEGFSQALHEFVFPCTATVTPELGMAFAST